MEILRGLPVIIPVVSGWLGVAPVQTQSITALGQAQSIAGMLGVTPRAITPIALTLPSPASRERRTTATEALDYARVRELFESAQDAAPTAAEMRRWRAGRLFKPERPAEPLNSLLAGADVDAPEGRSLRLFPIQTLRPVDDIPSRPELAQWVRDVIRTTPISGPGPEFSEKAVRFGLCAGGICHRYEVRRQGGLVLLRYQAVPEAGGEPRATWYGLYPKDVTPS